MTYYYLASPYSKHPKGPKVAFERVLAQTAYLMSYGIPIFSPIVYSHILESQGQVRGDHAYWMSVDYPFMYSAIGCIVFTDDGWTTSKGVQEEIEYFTKSSKPVFYAAAKEVPEMLLRLQHSSVHEAAV